MPTSRSPMINRAFQSEGEPITSNRSLLAITIRASEKMCLPFILIGTPFVFSGNDMNVRAVSYKFDENPSILGR